MTATVGFMIGAFASSFLNTAVLPPSGRNAFAVPRYDHENGSGDRTSTLVVTSDIAVTGSSSPISCLVDGLHGNGAPVFSSSFLPQDNRFIHFDFGAGVKKKITEAYWSCDSSSASWTLQASNDDIGWVNISNPTPQTTLGITGLKFSSTGINDGFYRYYQFVQSGASTTLGSISEIAFKILDESDNDNVRSLVAPTYSTLLGSGSRERFIDISSNINLSKPGGPEYIEELINGDVSLSSRMWFDGGQTARYIELDFRTPVLITEVRFLQNIIASQGTWQWQYWSGSTWVNVGTTFDVGDAATDIIATMSAHTKYHSRYRLQQISGTTSDASYSVQLEFKVGYPDTTVDFLAPSARHWRIDWGFLTVNNTQFSEIEMRNTVAGLNLATGGSVSFSSQFNGTTYAAANAFDGNALTDYAAVNNVGNWISYDFGVGNEVTINHLKLIPTAAFPNEGSSGFVVSYSADGTNYVPYCAVYRTWVNSTENYVLSDDIASEPNLSKTTAHRYWRLLTTQQGRFNNTQQITALELRNPSGVDLTQTVGGTASASSQQVGVAPAVDAFDNGLFTEWGASVSAAPAWLKWDFGAGNAQIVSSYAVRGSSNSNLTPCGWKLQCSDDDLNWKTLDWKLSVPAWGNLEERVYSL